MSISHRLPQDEALRRIQGLLGDVKTQFADRISNLRENWKGNVGTFSFSAMGSSVSGTLTVNATGVVLESKLPFAALPFRGRIEATLRERATTLLA